MNCSKCGAQNIDGVTFCGSCGTQMESHFQPPQTPQMPPQQNMPYQPPQYQQQQPYNNGGVTVGDPLNGGMVPPKNYMIESILVTLLSFTCCCSPISLILGIIAIIKANNVNTEFACGNMNEAISNSDSAKKLTLWAVIIAVISCILFWISYFSFLATILSEYGSLEELLNSM